MGLTAGNTAVRPADENLVAQDFLKFDNITSNVYILLLNRFLAVIMYWTNLVFAVNNIVKAVRFVAFQGSHVFPC